MALEIPPEVEPLMNRYGIPWPDVDEDAFRDIEQPLRDFGQSLKSVGDAIVSALQQLAGANPSHFVRALSTYAQTIRHDFLDRIGGACDDMAGTPCDATYYAIVAAKWVMIGLLTTEVANDLIDIVGAVATLGLDSAAAAAEAVALREAVSEALQIGEGQVVSVLAGEANNVVDELVNAVVNPFVNYVSNDVQSAVDSYLPRIVLERAAALELSAEGGASASLHLSMADLEHCIGSVATSANHLDAASSALSACIEEVFSHPAPNVPDIGTLSSAMRTLLREAMHQAKADLEAGARRLVDHVISHFVSLLEDFRTALVQLDDQARAAASREHMAAGPTVTVLSAAGAEIAAAAGVVATTGVIDARVAESVRVAGATAEDEAQQLAARSNEPAVALGVASASDDSAALERSKASSTVTTTAATSQGDNTQTLDTKRAGDGQPAGVTAAQATPGAEAQRLEGKHPDGHRPSVNSADASGHRATEVRVRREEGRRIVVDGTPVAPDEIVEQ